MTDSRIHRIHFGPVPPEEAPVWVDQRHELFAVWPAPIDADVCFKEAGFDDFADSDEHWDAAFERLIASVVGELARLGAPRIANPIRVQRPLSLWDGIRAKQPVEDVPPLLEQVRITTEDDRYPDTYVTFGDPPVASLRTGFGHPIFWMTIDRSVGLDPAAFAERVADGLPTAETRLDWSRLVPDDPPQRSPG